MSEFWTDERITELRRLWSIRGLSGAEIAERIGAGCTRNMVLGKVNRLKLPSRRPTGGPRAARKRRRAIIAPQPLPEPPHDAFGSAGEAVMALRPGQCRYPHGDPGTAGFCFCDREAALGSAYCADHHALCYRPIRVRGEGEAA